VRFSISPETKVHRDLAGPISTPRRDTEKLPALSLPNSTTSTGNSSDRWRGRAEGGRRDVGVLPDIAAPYAGHGHHHAPLLRRPRRPALRRRHRRIRLVLLPLLHHPRPRRHLDGQIPRLLSSSPLPPATDYNYRGLRNP
jgi:hypothetical protein